MKKKPKIPNLRDIPYSKALEIAKALSGKTNEEIAEEMGKGRETIRRYFTDPTYNPPAYLHPKLCKVLGNNILIEWQSVHAGGHFVMVNTEEDSDVHLELQIAQLTQEFADVLTEDGKARLNGMYEDDELSKIEKELDDLIKKGEQVKRLVYRKRKIGR